MNSLLKLYFVLLISCTPFACRDMVNYTFSVGEGEDLTIPVEDNTSDLLRLGGYYYSSSAASNDNTHFGVWFFYRNGVCRYNAEQSIDLEHLDKKLVNKKWENLNKRWYWGAYHIQKDRTIEIQYWTISDMKDPLYSSKGIIINDTTFILKTSGLAKNPDDHDSVNIPYSFRHLSFKPDSTNEYVKSP